MTFSVFFDGGNHPFNGPYGSWDVEYLGFKAGRRRIQFDPGTNNSAEYHALIHALCWLQSVKNKELYQVKIYGDSQLVLRQLSGAYQCHKPHLGFLRDNCLKLLAGFRDWSATWNARKYSVERFGH